MEERPAGGRAAVREKMIDRRREATSVERGEEERGRKTREGRKGERWEVSIHIYLIRLNKILDLK